MYRFPFSVKIVILIVIAILTSNCGKENHKNIKLGYVSAGLSGLAVELMKSKRIPEKYGITFEYMGFVSPSSMDQAFMMGKFDINLAVGANVVVLARSKGYRVQYLFPTLLNSVSLVVRENSPYKNLIDLKGKKIGWYGLSTGGGFGFYVICKKSGINPLKDFQLIQTQPPALIPLLEKGEVEGIIIYEPFVSKLLSTERYRILIGPFYKEWESLTGFPMEMAGLGAFEDWVNENEEVAIKVINVWKDTVKYIKENIRDVLTEFPQCTELRTEEELRLGIINIPSVYVDSWNDLDKSILEVLKILLEDKVVIQEIPQHYIRNLQK